MLLQWQKPSLQGTLQESKSTSIIPSGRPDSSWLRPDLLKKKGQARSIVIKDLVRVLEYSFDDTSLPSCVGNIGTGIGAH
jgi:hypothetical protein